MKRFCQSCSYIFLSHKQGQLTLIFSKQINDFENYLCAAVNTKRNILSFLIFVITIMFLLFQMGDMQIFFKNHFSFSHKEY